MSSSSDQCAVIDQSNPWFGLDFVLPKCPTKNKKNITTEHIQVLTHTPTTHTQTHTHTHTHTVYKHPNTPKHTFIPINTHGDICAHCTPTTDYVDLQIKTFCNIECFLLQSALITPTTITNYIML